jgi:hypothetical protein
MTGSSLSAPALKKHKKTVWYFLIGVIYLLASFSMMMHTGTHRDEGGRSSASSTVLLTPEKHHFIQQSKQNTLNATISSHKTKRYNRLKDPWIMEERKNLVETFYSAQKKKGRQLLLQPADDRGPVLDFLVAGWPKCGTTTLEANLGAYAPMPVSDICVPLNTLVWYAYVNWPQEYDPDGVKPLRGNKCPNDVDNAREITTYLPKTKIILGIRHPITWFQSFWNMLARSKSVTKRSYHAC